MKIVFVSDTHISSPTSGRLWSTLERLAELEPDIVLWGGDLIDHVGGWETLLTECTSSLPDAHMLFLAGNHDLWMPYHPEAVNSSRVFDTELPELVKMYGHNWAEDSTFISDDNRIAIVGTIGWYDYSVKDLTHTHYPNEYFASQKKNYNNDGNFVKFDEGVTDVSFSKNLLDNLKKRIKELPDAVKTIIIFTHVPVFSDCVVFKPWDHRWTFGSSYFYNLTLGEELRGIKKLRLVLSGHTHCEKEGMVEGVLGNKIKYIVSGSDYGKPQLVEAVVGPRGGIKIKRHKVEVKGNYKRIF